ncbi:MAG: tRNA (adenosine(37)-N6)-threonylcarbamoyltransferase complex ATPase subunit type 1 TsaE [Chloroflexi bacterium]|nr:tRNA (adenosine(37)-N6)-threonylcarbamoyltransferase complex ATPase subunit type 1 TsaE [Chloroflexota bacterium]
MTNKGLKIESTSPEETLALGEKLGKLAQAGDVILLQGKLGAGKTCLTQGIARGLHITDYVMSPTFVLVRELQGRLPLYHMDLYRLDNLAEIDDLGLDEYLYGNGLSVVEWADKAVSLLPPDHLLIKIEYTTANGRHLELLSYSDRYHKLLTEIKNR